MIIRDPKMNPIHEMIERSDYLGFALFMESYNSIDYSELNIQVIVYTIVSQKDSLMLEMFAKAHLNDRELLAIIMSICANQGFVESIEIFKNLGIDLDLQTPLTPTMLHQSILNANLGFAKTLMQAGADIDAEPFSPFLPWAQERIQQLKDDMAKERDIDDFEMER